MQATMTQLARDTKKVIRPVIHGGQEVVVTDRGRPVARIVPYTLTITVSPEEARRGHLSDQAILNAIRDDRAEALSPFET